MPIETTSAIRLETAYLCLNCQAITNCSDVCPVCGHGQLWHLEHWLGRVNPPECIEDKVSTSQEVQPVKP